MHCTTFVRNTILILIVTTTIISVAYGTSKCCVDERAIFSVCASNGDNSCTALHYRETGASDPEALIRCNNVCANAHLRECTELWTICYKAQINCQVDCYDNNLGHTLCVSSCYDETCWSPLTNPDTNPCFGYAGEEEPDCVDPNPFPGVEESGCTAQCLSDALKKQRYTDTCPSFDFTAAGSTTTDSGPSTISNSAAAVCEPECRRSLFDYFDAYENCASRTCSDTFASEVDDHAAQRAAFESCGGSFGNTGLQFSVGWGWSFTTGDPHFQTLDGLDYTYNGKGDFWLSRGESANGVKLQVRIDECGLGAATCITGVAIATGVQCTEQIVVISKAPSLSEAGCDLQVTVGGTVTEQSATLGSPGDTLTIGATSTHACAVQVESINGIKIEVTVDDGIVGVAVALVYDLNGRVLGLYGNYNKDPSDDLTDSSGNQYPIPGTDSDVWEFGESWRVKRNEALFLDPPPNHNGWVPTFLTDIEINADVTAKCKAAGLSDDALASCQFDVQVSGDEKFVNIIKNAGSYSDKKSLETSTTVSSSMVMAASSASSLPVHSVGWLVLNVLFQF